MDVQEQLHGEKSDTISGFLFFVCLFTILANILLFYIILSQKELRVQVILTLRKLFSNPFAEKPSVPDFNRVR